MSTPATMAGQSNDDTDKLECDFDELAVELGWESSDLWEVCENQHSASQGL